MKDGCFTKFPEYSTDLYKPITDYKPLKRVVNNSGKMFFPHEGPKSIPQVSVINYNVGIKVNQNTYKDAINNPSVRLTSLTAH